MPDHHAYMCNTFLALKLISLEYLHIIQTFMFIIRSPSFIGNKIWGESILPGKASSMAWVQREYNFLKGLQTNDWHESALFKSHCGQRGWCKGWRNLTRRGAEEVEEGKLKGRGRKERTELSCGRLYLGRKRSILHRQISKDVWQEKNVVRWGRWAAGLFVLCPVGMVEIWSGLQLSRGVWPHRLAPGIVATAQSHAGDTERRLGMNVGVGLDVCVDVDVNEPLHDWEREKDRKRKERGRSKSRKGGKRTTRLTGKKQGQEHTVSQQGNWKQGESKHLKIYTLNNNNLLICPCGYCTAPNKMLTLTVKHIHYSPTGTAENDGKGQHTLWKWRSRSVNINKREYRLLSFSVNPSCFRLPYSFRKVWIGVTGPKHMLTIQLDRKKRVYIYSCSRYKDSFSAEMKTQKS